MTVDVHDGNHHEVGETFFLNLTNASGASISDAQGVATIIDNDPPPEVTIDDVVLDEADGELSFTLLKSAQTGAPATVDYGTTDGSATSPDDYGPVSGTVTFGGPDTVAHVAVQITDDALDEGTETFTITLSNPQGLTIVDGLGVGTITDDDPEPSLSVNNVSVTEGNSGTVAATFTVSLSSGQRPDRHRRLCDGERHRGGRLRLPGGGRHAQLRSRRHHEDRHSPRQRGHARRERRKLLPQPVQRFERVDPRRARTRDDH